MEQPNQTLNIVEQNMATQPQPNQLNKVPIGYRILSVFLFLLAVQGILGVFRSVIWIVIDLFGSHQIPLIASEFPYFPIGLINGTIVAFDVSLEIFLGIKLIKKSTVNRRKYLYIAIVLFVFLLVSNIYVSLRFR